MRAYTELYSALSPIDMGSKTDHYEILLLEDYDYTKVSYDYGIAFVYHFFQKERFQQYYDLVRKIQNLITNNPKLSNVEVVPLYEVGDDFLVQCKPFSEGYRSCTFQEYLSYGSCRPAPWFFKQWSQLQESVDESMSGLGLYERMLLHSQLIKPNGNLYWVDDDGWLLYLPSLVWDEYDYGDIHLMPKGGDET